VRVLVETPTKLSRDQRELLEQLAEISGEDTNPRSRSFWEAVGDLLGANAAKGKKG
jgi:molecular chaperone DnaJ